MREIRSIQLVAAVSLLALAGCGEEQQRGSSPVAERQVPVIAEQIGFEHARTRVEAVGTSRAVLSAELYGATSGEVVAVNFEPGQAVRRGDVLVELDRREEELAVRAARLRLEDAERLYDRYQRSAGSGAVLPTTLDAARTAAETARVELERALLALEERSIEAVFDGHVGVTEIDPGDRIDPDTLITTLDDRSALLVSFDIPETFIGELVVGDSVRLETWSSSMPGVTGEIVDIGSRVDPQNRTFVARARVDNVDDRLRPGMSFRVDVEMKGERYAVIGETGVQWGIGGAYVWSIPAATGCVSKPGPSTLSNGEGSSTSASHATVGACTSCNAARVPVQVIQRREGRVLVDGDFDAGDLVVVEGSQRMRDGVAVSYNAEILAERNRRAAGGSVGAATHGALD